jgi:hypothetical protein
MLTTSNIPTPPFRKTERALDQLFRMHLDLTPEFAPWLLSRTKFAGVNAKLVNEPWQFQWYRSPTTGIESETDIFLVFQRLDAPGRFALHIENKMANGKFTPNQPRLYHVRANDWMTKRRYNDYETVLIAPRSFYAKYKTGAEEFHRYIPHEDIARFIPQFAP